ncbi:MAG: NAD-dependent protein deacylase [Brevinematales bacterium]|nr:NAD-dependent protein deacylase [Brevinematales bacterium]
MNSELDILMELIVKSSHIVALTGAGISTNSGIPDFRGPNGLYRGNNEFEKLFSIEYFREHPNFFYSNFNEMFHKIKNANPNKGHMFLKKLEDMGKLKVIITQNIDGLHKKAGNTNVIELHGNLEKFICISCYHLIENDTEQYKKAIDKMSNKDVPHCEKCNGILKPDVVFFGEYVHDLEKALTEVQKADLLLTIGTSLVVYPASTLPSYIDEKAKLVIINREPTPYDEKAKVVLYEDIDVIADKLKIL